MLNRRNLSPRSAGLRASTSSVRPVLELNRNSPMSLDGGGFGFGLEAVGTEPAGWSGSGNSILEVSPELGKSEDGLRIGEASPNFFRASSREVPGGNRRLGDSAEEAVERSACRTPGDWNRRVRFAAAPNVCLRSTA